MSARGLRPWALQDGAVITYHATEEDAEAAREYNGQGHVYFAGAFRYRVTDVHEDCDSSDQYVYTSMCQVVIDLCWIGTQVDDDGPHGWTIEIIDERGYATVEDGITNFIER